MLNTAKFARAAQQAEAAARSVLESFCFPDAALAIVVAVPASEGKIGVAVFSRLERDQTAALMEAAAQQSSAAAAGYSIHPN